MQTASVNSYTEVVDGILLFDCRKMSEYERIQWLEKQDTKECLYTEHGCKLWGEGQSRGIYAIVYDFRKVHVKRFMDVSEAIHASLVFGWTKLGISPDGGEMYWKKV